MAVFKWIETKATEYQGDAIVTTKTQEKKRNSRGFDSLTLNDLDLSTHLQADRFARIDVQVHNVLAGCGWW